MSPRGQLEWIEGSGFGLGQICGSRFSPAHSSLAQISSAITRGSGPSSAAMLRGVASTRYGSKRRGQPLPLLAVPEEPGAARSWAALERAPTGLPSVPEPDGALDVVAYVHPVHRGDPRRARLPFQQPGRRPRGTRPQPSAGLEQVERTLLRTRGVGVEVACQRPPTASTAADRR